MKAADGNATAVLACTTDVTTRRGTTASPAKAGLMAALGKTTVTDVETKEYIRTGASDKLASRQESCMNAAGTNATAVLECAASGKKILATALGKSDDAVTAMDFGEMILQASCRVGLP